MPSYKVSYKILRQQGDDMKAVAKLVDGYAERVAQVSGKLGEGELLAQVRTNLGKLREQLGESRAVLNTAGEFLTKTVDSYTGVELRQIKKADSTRAHNRDFYKNPVVVASVGGAAGGVGVAASMPSPAASASAVPAAANYTDNSVNVSYVAVESAPAAAAAAAPEVMPTAAASASTAAPAAASAAGVGSGVGIAAGAGVVGAAIGAGAAIGVKHLADQNKKAKATDNEKERQDAAQDEYDPEAELEKAIARVRELEGGDDDESL